jgi:hypothetical protein
MRILIDTSLLIEGEPRNLGSYYPSDNRWFNMATVSFASTWATLISRKVKCVR